MKQESPYQGLYKMQAINHLESRGLSNDALSQLMRNVYSWMSLALLVTGLTALFVVKNLTIAELIFSNSITIWVIIIAQLGLALLFTAKLHKISFNAAILMFIGYAILTGVTFSSLFILYTSESIASTFFITAATFGTMSLYGFFTKKDLTKWGNLLIMGLWGIIIASLINFIFKSPTVMWITTIVGVLVFVGLTAYDTQKIKLMLSEYANGEVNEGTYKLALYGSFMLYLDFINLFLKLLRILGKRK